MGFNGSGTFIVQTVGTPVVTGTVISSTVQNAFSSELATGLSTCITKDGQTTATARIPFALGINSSLTTDTSSIGTGSIITAGGIGIAKQAWVGTTLMVAGDVVFFGGSAATNISLRRSTTNLEVKLGDASAYANVTALSAIMTSSVLYLGGATSSDLSLRRNGTEMRARLGDDSAYAGFGSSYLVANSSIIFFNGSAATDVSLRKSSTTLRIRLGDDSNYAPMQCAGIQCTDLTTTGTVNLNGASGTFVNSVTVLNGVVTGGS